MLKGMTPTSWYKDLTKEGKDSYLIMSHVLFHNISFSIIILPVVVHVHVGPVKIIDFIEEINNDFVKIIDFIVCRSSEILMRHFLDTQKPLYQR